MASQTLALPKVSTTKVLSGLFAPARVKTKTVLQMEGVECGAASLSMILGFYGRHVTLEKLRIACGVSRDGSKAHNILKAARDYGLDARGFKKETHMLRAERSPYIVFWNFDHFLVVEGFSRKYAYLNDPAAGRRKVTLEEFDQSFTGVVLTFNKTSAFRKGGERQTMIGSIRDRLAGAQQGVIYSVLATLALAVPNLLISVFPRVYTDSFLIHNQIDYLKPLLFAMICTTAFKAMITWSQQESFLRLESKLSIASSSAFFWHVLHLPVEFFAQRFAGEIGSRVAVNDKVAILLSGEVATNVVSLLLIAAYGALMARYDPVLTLVCVGISLLNVLCLKWVSAKRQDDNRRLLQENGKLFGTSLAGLQMIETLKATGGESDFFSRWSGYQAKVVKSSQELGSSSQLLTVLPPFLTSISSVAVLGLGGLRVVDGFLTMGMLIAFQSLLASFTEPVNRVVDLGGQLQEADGDLRRLNDVLKYPAEKAIAPINGQALESNELERLRGYLELRNVTFGYSRLEPPLIENFNLKVTVGARVALVGGSGSGKSTIAKLLSGLHEPWSGEILFDGKPRQDIPRSVLTNSISVVDQDVFLFEGTVRDNLSMLDTTVPDPLIVEAAKDACIHDEMTQRPGGYEWCIEESGRNLSGGQRQRLEIARALTNEPAVLILDEATSALDPHVEQKIDRNLRRRGCTCVIIAHRLSAIRDCDEIVCLERGKVVERGTHSELMQKGGHYAVLAKAD